jgi:hypothetical protein
VSLNGTVIGLDLAKLIPTGSGNSRFDQGAHLHTLGVLEKQTRRPDEFERIPLDRVVTGRNHQAARCVVMLDSELAGWRRRQPDVDHIASNRLKRA